ncbi:hypothetical protein ACMTN4_07535 [Rhodococcus globerulus]|uniref:hypothetical protein n=1 Tax=Rhodococcus globerulus TaxID=33008 RepID=UPI0039ED823D
MGTILVNPGSPQLVGPASASGFLPALGAPGYVNRWDAADLPGVDGASVPLDTQWKSRISDDVWWVAQANLTTGLPGIKIRNGRKYTDAGSGNARGYASRTQLEPVPNFTVALTVNPVTNGESRYFYKIGGYILGLVGGVGWVLATRDPGVAPSIKATTSVASATAVTDVPCVVIASWTESGDVRLKVKRSTDAAVLATASGVTPGKDRDKRLLSPAYGTATHATGKIVEWHRVITPSEEDSVIAGLAT